MTEPGKPETAPLPGEDRLAGGDSVTCLRGWFLIAILLAIVVAVPLLVIASSWLAPENTVWKHLAETVLNRLVINTLVLAAGVSAGVLVLGVGLAWLTSMCEFPGRRFFDWALMLPLAIPAYVLAFVMVGLFDFSGPVQSLLRAGFDGGGNRFPEIRSAGGTVIIMVLALYPYVYMLARSAFLTQGRITLEAARVLGYGAWGGFFRAVLPMARPAIVAGVALALMETLADFGAVSVLNYDTFTTAIYKAWFGLFSLQAAAQLATLLLLFVSLALYAERHLRGRSRYHDSGTYMRPRRWVLKGGQALMASAVSGIIFGLAFLVPTVQLLIWAGRVVRDDFTIRYLDLLIHTLVLGTSAAMITVASAFLLAYVRRLRQDRLTRSIVAVSTLGYALPGTVLAVGIMLTFAGVDRFAGYAWLALGGGTPGRLLSGTICALLLAYLIRFLAVAYGPIESGFARIRSSLAEAARNLGATHAELIRRVYLPLLRPGLLTAMLLVVVEVMKEMPATLLLRPFGWDTLAVRIFEMTSEGEWQRAALPAVTLELIGLIPVMLLVMRSSDAVAGAVTGDIKRKQPPGL